MRKFFAAAAALALGLGVVLVGAVVAHADGEVSAEHDGDIHTSDAAWNLYGSTQAGYGVTSATITYSGSAAADAAAYCTFTTDYDGGTDNWGCTLPRPTDGFPVGPATFTAQYGTEGSPTSSFDIEFTVLADPPPAPTVTVDPIDDNYAHDPIVADGDVVGGATIDDVVLVRDDGTSTPFSILDDCTIPEGDGPWSCEHSDSDGFALGDWTLTVTYSKPDLEGTFSAEADFAITNPSPDLAFDSFGSDSTISVTATLTGHATTPSSTIVLYDWSSGTGINTSTGCPWESDVQPCTVALLSGPGEIRAVQNWDPVTSPTASSIYFRVPDAPTTYAYPQGDGTVVFTGWDTGFNDLITITDADGDPVCPPTTDSYCQTAGDYDLRQPVYVTATDTCDPDDSEGPCADELSADFPDGFESSYVTGAVSATYVVTNPLASYVFRPGGITVVATPTAAGTVAGVQYESYLDYAPGCPDLMELEEGDYFGANPAGQLLCSTDLTPGPWAVYTYQDTGDGQTQAESSTEAYFSVDSAPHISTVAGNILNVVRITGDVGAAPDPYSEEPDNRGGEGDIVHVMSGSTDLCDAVVDADGTWACTTANALPGGSYSIQATIEDVLHTGCDCSYGWDYLPGGLSPLSDGFGLSLPTLSTGGGPTGTTGTPGTTPTLPTAPFIPSWTFDLSGLDLSHVHPGDKFTITGAGLPAGSVITIELHSTPVVLGSATVASNGTFSLKGTIPSSVEAGAHHITATMTGAGLSPSSVDKAITVEVGSSDASTTTQSGAAGAEKNAESTGGEGGGAHEIIGVGGAPNVLTHSMTTLQDVINHPAKISAAIAIGLVLIIFAMIPAHLLNATLSEQYERFSGRIARIRRPQWFERFTGWLKRTPVVGGILLTFITSLLFAFIDPDFGPNLQTLRLVLALTIALFVVGFVSNWISARILQQRFRLDVQLRLRPLGLILTIVAVIVSRLLDFSPGFLIGLVMGLSIVEHSAAKRAWVAVVVRSSVIFGIGLVAWLGYSFIMGGGHEGEETSFATELFSEALIAITTEGIVMILVELLPIRLLEGERLWQRSKLLWSVVYFLVLVLFVLAVVPWEGNWEVLGDSLWAWIAIVVGFGVVCMAIYLYFRFWAKPLHHETAEELEHEQVSIADDA